MVQNKESILENKSETGVPLYEKVSFFFLLVLVFFLPIFFLPNVSFHVGKSIFLTTAALLSFIFWIFGSLKKRELNYSRNVFFITIFFLPLPFFLSALFSGISRTAILGTGFEIGTLVSILLGVILVLLCTEVLNTKKRVFYFYVTFFSSCSLLALYQISRLVIGPDFLSFGVFTTLTSNVIGKWNELGIFFGLAAILSLIMIENFTQSRLIKSVGLALLAVSLFFVAIVNFYSVWIMVGLFALISAIYLVCKSPRNLRVKNDGETEVSVFKKRKLPLFSLSVFVIALVFIFLGSKVGNMLTTRFGLSELEVRPSWESTIEVSKNVLTEDPILGSGPNSFVNEWLEYKPRGINLTPFWNTDFNFGVGLIPTYILTTGLLGGIVWIIFFLAFFQLASKVFSVRNQDVFSRYVIFSSLFGALYLWIYNIIYIPTHVLYFLSFLFTGVFLASLQAGKVLEVRKKAYNLHSRKDWIPVIFLILCFSGSVALGYLSIQKFVSALYIEKAIKIFNANNKNVSETENYILKAVNAYKTDEYYRILTQLYTHEMNLLLVNEEGISVESLRPKVEAALSKAVESANGAIKVKPENYQNHIVLGALYESLIPLGFKDAYQTAKKSYEEAFRLNPNSPAILVLKARLEAANNNPEGAKELIFEALKMKSNYTEAIYFLSQVEISQDNIKGAIEAVEAVSNLKSDDPTVFFQLGFLRYSDKNYAGAAEALERAVNLSNNYSNARYFLGLSYYKLDRVDDAVEQFVEIQKFNSDNQEVALILRNLRNDREPFDGVEPPLDDKPEERGQLPVEEESE